MKYKNTKKTRILNNIDKKDIKHFGMLFGYRETAEHFNIPPGIVRQVVKDEGGKRPADLCKNLYQAVEKGTKSPEDFPHLDFSGTALNELVEELTTQKHKVANVVTNPSARILIIKTKEK